MTKDKIWLSSPHMGNKEREFVEEAFASNWIAPLGPHVDGFEQDISEFTGVAHVAALSSGTAAIHLALVMLGIAQGDYVLCQSFTFAGTANPISYLGAIPVFIDSEPESWNMCPDAMEQAILALQAKGKRVKAVIPVHLYGVPANMTAIKSIAEKYGLYVIEDAAEALGSVNQGKACGSEGDIGILSFNGNKIITTSGGGALISNNETWVKQARFLATQARDDAPHYQHSHIGYNYRMSNVCAAIGRGQMLVLEERIAQRRAINRYYRERLGTIPGITFQNEPEGTFANFWLSVITIDPALSGGITREDIRIALNQDNIDSRPTWKPMHLQPIFAGAPYYGGQVSEQFFEKGLCLPSSSNMQAADLERVVDGVIGVLNR
jgi:dTDP-4-amino-4,6-dideoxygalactose transaminase